jgi:hypothetical protein
LDHYQIAWRLVHGGEPPASPWYQEKYLDKIERDYLSVNAEYQREVQRRSDIDKAFDVKAIRWARDYRLEIWSSIRPGWLPDKLLHVHQFKHRGKDASMWLDGDVLYVDLNDGGPEWQIVRGNRQELVRQLQLTGLRQSALTRVCDWLLFVWSEELERYASRFLPSGALEKTAPDALRWITRL